MRRGIIGLVVLWATVGALILAATVAAKTVELHKYNGVHPAGSFNGADAIGGTAPFPEGLHDMSIFQETGQVFVGNANSSRVYKFSAAGVSEPFSALAPATVLNQGLNNYGDVAVDNSATATKGRIYAFPESGPVSAYEPNGTPAPNFPISINGACGGDVAPDGTLWVVTWNSGKATQYNPITGAPTGVSFATPTPCDLAIDSQGNFYAVQESTRTVRKYNSSGVLQGVFAEDTSSGGGEPEIAIDISNDDVYVDYQTFINHYDKTGALVYKFGQSEGSYPGLDASRGLAVRASNHMVYADNEIGGVARVDTFITNGPVVVPDATTGAASAVTRNSATLNATLNPDGVATTECKFQWGTTTAYSGGTVPCSEGDVHNGTTNIAVTAPLSLLARGTLYHFRIVAANANGITNGLDQTFTTISAVKSTLTKPATNITKTTATLNGSFDADGFATNYYFEYGPTTTYGTKVPLPAPPGANVGTPVGTYEANQNISGLTQNTLYHYRIVAENSEGKTNGLDATFSTEKAVKDVATLPATNVKATSVTFNGTFDPNGLSTTYYFEYGTTLSYGSYAPVTPPGTAGGNTVGPKAVSVDVSGLFTGVTYNFRLVAVNTFGATKGLNLTVVPNEAPTLTFDYASDINTDGGNLRALINPNALATTYRFEYGVDDCTVVECEKTADIAIGSGIQNVPVSLTLANLSPDSTYHFRVVTTNSRGTTTGVDHVFKTFALESGADNCPNVLVRKQTGAGVAPRCRAYELVSAVDSGGYDIESNLIPGLSPMEGYPHAEDKVLYTVLHGAIPDSGNPPNLGGDPYVATREGNGWSTEYVGLQADTTPSLLPFSSALAEADAGLGAFAFGGSAICDPCFADGSTNIPLRLPNGSLVQGMAGSEDPGPADPAGEVRKHFSGDGSHFVFGSTARFEPSGNSGSLSIYDRNLDTDTTQVVSTMPNGSTMVGAGLAQLDISEDGSRVLIGRLVGTDSAGNKSYDLYMHVGTDPNSVLIADTASGVLYAGMSSDGTKVFFTTADPLADDADAGADLFRADVSPTSATVSRVSTGIESSGNANGCDPVPNTDGNNWNAVGVASTNSCGVVAIAGGGGISSGDGTAFLLSPEKLDGSANGTADQPNLYIAEPGSPPKFLATLEPNNPLIRHAVSDSEKRDTADFQVTPDGAFSVFATTIPLTDASSAGHVEVFRYTSGGDIACVSCTPTNGAPSTDTILTSGGLNLVDDGRVVLTSSEQLVLRDTNRVKDVYEWDDGAIGLISTGLDTNDSGLLTASADGKDVFFFTRQTLAPDDRNGGAMKIYDAREFGGFLFNPPPPPCKASDECHGAGTQVPPPPPINTYEGTGEPQPPITTAGTKRCRKGFAKKRGKCVRKRQARRNTKGTRR